MDSEIIEKSSKTWYSVIVASSEFGTVQKTTINISFNLLLLVQKQFSFYRSLNQDMIKGSYQVFDDFSIISESI